jgi:hypothetical protein
MTQRSGFHPLHQVVGVLREGLVHPDVVHHRETRTGQHAGSGEGLAEPSGSRTEVSAQRSRSAAHTMDFRL